MPGSLVDVRPVRDPAYLEGKSLEFKVIKLDQRRNNVVVSRRAVVEQEYSAEREELLESLQEGNTVKGIVKNLTDYGAFVDLGGVDGLLHITDMAWKRIRHPSEMVNVGDEVCDAVERMGVDLPTRRFHRGSIPWTASASNPADTPMKNVIARPPSPHTQCPGWTSAVSPGGHSGPGNIQSAGRCRSRSTVPAARWVSRPARPSSTVKCSSSTPSQRRTPLSVPNQMRSAVSRTRK